MALNFGDITGAMGGTPNLNNLSIHDTPPLLMRQDGSYMAYNVQQLPVPPQQLTVHQQQLQKQQRASLRKHTTE